MSQTVMSRGYFSSSSWRPCSAAIYRKEGFVYEDFWRHPNNRLKLPSIASPPDPPAHGQDWLLRKLISTSEGPTLAFMACRGVPDGEVVERPG